MTTPQRILVKVGGSILDDDTARAVFASSVAEVVAAGHSLVVVHGGGAQVTRLTDALGLVPRRVRGLRVTDDDTALAVLQVLGGEVNAVLVDALQRAMTDAASTGELNPGGVNPGGMNSDGVNPSAVGLTGADGGLLQADVLDERLGHVGVVRSVRASVLDRLTSVGFVPVVATVVPASAAGERFLNVNADDAVAPIAAAWNADVVLFLSDVPHVIAGGSRLPSLERASVAALEADGTILGGMIPKVHAALDAAESLPNAIVKIASGIGAKRHGVLQSVIPYALEPEHGTRFSAPSTETSHA